MALNFRNILELYGIPAGASSQTSFTITENVDLFFNIFDKSKDDLVSRSEFEKIIKNRNMPTSMVDNFFDAYAGKDDYLTKDELNAALNAIDSNNNDIINFNEVIDFYNGHADVDLDTNANYTQYATFFVAANNALTDLDKITKDGVVDVAEYAAYLDKVGMQGRYASQMIDLFDVNGDGKIGFEEFFSTYVDWDANRDGILDMTNKDENLREATELYELNKEALKVQKLSSMPVYYENVLNIFGVNVMDAGSNYDSTVYDVAKNAKDFIEVIDENFGDEADKGDGEASLEQVREFMESIGLPASIADTLMSIASGGGTLTRTEFENFLRSNYDSNVDDRIGFEEALEFFNDISGFGIDIDVAADFDGKDQNAFTYYSYHFNTTKNLIINFDANENGEIDTAIEANAALKSIGIPEGYADAFINLIDEGVDNSISFEDYFKKLLDWDRSKDGILTFYNEDGTVTDGSTNADGIVQDYGVDYVNFLPELYRRYEVGSIENQAQQLILTVDADQDLEISAEEYAKVLSEQYAMPASMGEELVRLYDIDNNGSISFNELVEAYEKFDTITVDEEGNQSAGADGKVTYEEMVAFQNTLTRIDINTDKSVDPKAITAERYNGLYQTSASVIASIDEDKDGEITVDEYRAVLRQQYTAIEAQTGVKTEAPEQVVENFIRTFDLDKDGKVNVIELMNVYSEYDKNLDGTLLNSEVVDLNAKLLDSTLWDAVNNAVFNEADVDKNDKLTIEEYKAFLRDNGMPEILADSAFVAFDATDGLDINDGFDIDGDGMLSRLELMEAFSRYDGSAINTKYITEFVEAQTGVTGFNYNLYTGNKDNKLGADEHLKMLEDIANRAGYTNADSTALDFGVSSAKKGQYAPIMQSITEFAKVLDFNADGLVSADEYKTYLETQDLPDYLADNAVDNAIVDWDLNDDDHLDFVEWLKVNFKYDTNANGELGVEEVLNMTSELAQITLNATISNRTSYEKFYEKASIIIENFDKDSNKILTADELQDYMKQFQLPDILAEHVIDNYSIHDDTADGFDQGLDIMEFLKAFASFDTNNNGVLEFEEEYALYDNVYSVELGVDKDNAAQYKKIQEATSELFSKYDLNKDHKLASNELEKFFKDRGISVDAVTQVLAMYDVEGGPDGMIDVLEWMRMYYDFDADMNGVISNQENLALMDTLVGTGLNPTAANEVQLTAIEKDIDAIITKYDVNGDKNLSVEELKGYMRELQVPDYLAEVIIHDVAGNYGFVYNQDGNDTLDKLEFMRLKADFDINNNGKLDFDEEYALYATGAGATSTPSVDDIKQYSTLYNTAKKMFAQKDVTTDRILTAEELGSYFTALNLPANMAEDAIDLYNKNKSTDDGLDIYEWMEVQIRFDVNKNGVLDFNEQLAFLGEIANPDINFDPALTDAAKVNALYNYAVTNIKKYGGADNNLSGEELRNWLLKTAAMSLDDANEIVAHYDSTTVGVGNGDGLLNALELAKILVELDIAGNNNGAWNTEEIMQFMNDGLSNIDFGSITMEEHKLYQNAIYNVNKYAGNDKELSNVELSNMLLKYWGVTPNMAAQIISHYNTMLSSTNDTLDVNELAQIMIQLDANNNGVFDNAEMMNFIQDALPAIDFGEVNDSNATQKYGLFNTALYNIDRYAGSDNELSANEILSWLTKDWGISANMAASIVDKYDTNNSKTLNVAELAHALINLDVAGNNDGKFDNAEIMNFIDAAVDSGVSNFGGVDASNYAEKFGLYNNAVYNVNKYAGDDKKFSAIELSNWLSKDWGVTVDRAAEIINHYDDTIGNGDDALDVVELAQAFMSLNANNDSKIDNAEMMNFIGAALADINFGGVNDSNVTQKNGLFNTALYNIDKYAGGDKAFTASELKTWLQKTWGLTNDMAAEIIEHYNTDGSVDADGNQTMDVFEFAQALINLDQVSNNGNNDGKWGTAETLNFLNNGLSSTNIGTITADNATQANQLYYNAMNLIKSADKTNDQKISADEYYTYYLAKLGLPQYVADGFIAAYDKNGDGLVDAMELVERYMGLDANKTGALDSHESILDYQTMANVALEAKGFGADTFNFNPTISNSQQITSAFNIWKSFVVAKDANADRLIQENEYKQYLMTDATVKNFVKYNTAFDTNSNGKMDSTELTNGTQSVSSTMAANAVSTYDLNGDGALDTFEWMDAILKFDTDSNGQLNGTELTEFYKSIGLA